MDEVHKSEGGRKRKGAEVCMGRGKGGVEWLTCEAHVKGQQGVCVCVGVGVCMLVPTSIIRHRGLVRVPLLLEDNVAKLKH